MIRAMREALRRLPIDGFLGAILLAVALASIDPSLGASHGPLRLDIGTTVGIGLVFLLNGLGLSPDRLKAGARNWRLHLFVQSATYLLFPLVGIALMTGLRGWLPNGLLVGVFFLCTLSSTVSTSIAMTTLARGNVAAAVFNAALSSLLGMVITPLLVSLWLQAGGNSLSVEDQLLDVAAQLLLPFVAGQMLRPWLAGWLTRHKAVTSKVDRFVIVLIVYHSFCNSVQAGLWHRYGTRPLLEALLLTGGLLASVLATTTFLARRLGFSKEDEIVAVFCGSKKSLATGVPMAKLLFGGGSGDASTLGLIVLPILLYHQLQLLAGAVLARRYALRAPGTGVRPPDARRQRA